MGTVMECTVCQRKKLAEVYIDGWA